VTVEVAPCPDCGGHGTVCLHDGPAYIDCYEGDNEGQHDVCLRCDGSGSVPSRCPTCGSNKASTRKFVNNGRGSRGPCRDLWHGGGSDTRKDAPN
jgi:hypothetical protein